MSDCSNVLTGDVGLYQCIIGVVGDAAVARKASRIAPLLRDKVMFSLRYHIRHHSNANTHFSSFRNRLSGGARKSSHKGGIHKLPGVFLRLNDERYLDATTFQRNDFHFDKVNGKPLPKEKRVGYSNIEKNGSIVKVKPSSDKYEIKWKDGHTSFFDSKWIETQIKRRQSPKNPELISEKSTLHPSVDLSSDIPRRPWSKLTEEDIRSESQNHQMRFDFHEVVNREDAILKQAVRSLFQYGIVFITSTPTSDNGAGVAALASALSGSANKLSPETSLMAHYLHCNEANGNTPPPSILLERGTDGPQKTMYGNVWYTNASAMMYGTSTADSAYGNEGLPLHTDFTYSRDPPGLQIFTMVSPAERGGESLFADGLAIAEYMRKKHYKEFDTLCRIRRRYRSIDKEHGWYLEGSGPVIEAIDMWEGLSVSEFPTDADGSRRWGPVVAIRHNDLDRLPDLPPNINFDDSEEGHSKQKEYDNAFLDELKQAHEVWDELIGRDEFRLEIGLRAGETAVVANQRCMHGRLAFSTGQSPRSVMGCYVSQDDVESRIRWMLNGNCNFK